MLRLRCLFILLVSFLSSCVSSNSQDSLPPPGPLRCKFFVVRVDWNQPIEVLNTVSRLFRNNCYEDTIRIASKTREKYRYKKYSLTKEAAEIFLAEGAVTDYVLESYERGYLSFLATLSYLKLDNEEAASVELNRFYNEEVDVLYNHGQDPINALLQAALWDNFPREGYSSRPFWLWLTKAETAPLELQKFAKARVGEIDSKKPATWEISEVGLFPEVDWSMKFQSSNSGYLSIRPRHPFLSTCADNTSILVPTASWFHKIAIRHSHDYHPLVNAKSWVRLPIGMALGFTTFAAGASILVGGCAADLAGKGEGALCKLSILNGTALMEQSDDVVDATLRPDLRHWEKLPAAIWISRKGSQSNECFEVAKDLGVRRLL